MCKRYHDPQKKGDQGRRSATRKSRCPGWLSDDVIRKKLLDEALVDPDGQTDAFGNPKVLWNAIGGWYFVGVSANLREPTYNCYPEVPASALRAELDMRAGRALEDLERGEGRE